MSLLFRYILDDDINAVTNLIQDGCDINVENTFGETPLYYAVSSRNPEIVKLLVSAGVDVNDRKHRGTLHTVLHLAAVREPPELLSTLLTAGADVNWSRAPSSYAPLSWAYTTPGDDFVEQTRLLLAAGADPFTVFRDKSAGPKKRALITNAQRTQSLVRCCMALILTNFDDFSDTRLLCLPGDVLDQLKYFAMLNYWSGNQTKYDRLHRLQYHSNLPKQRINAP